MITYFLVSDPCIGPISEHVPQRFWQHISKETLDSYLVATYESGEKLRKIMPGVPVIVRGFSATVYEEVIENLTERGKEAVEAINPWLMVTLIDVEELDKVICTKFKGNTL